MPNKGMILNGTVVRGLGEGAYFISMRHYQKEIKKKLGFNAYPGTLNLRVDKKQTGIFKNIAPIRIDGYRSGNKTFGGASCYKAKIKNTSLYFIMPDLTKHKNVVELIAPFRLKSKLKLKDGDKIKVKLLK
ncbi:CTP-dependent riboflavin kinase [Candidatus Woesearchaeota archaeon]|nr:CTP-dependent riboflavin kinase [Candidatus Woesearchaeota archaeon]